MRSEWPAGHPPDTRRRRQALLRTGALEALTQTKPNCRNRIFRRPHRSNSPPPSRPEPRRWRRSSSRSACWRSSACRCGISCSRSRLLVQGEADATRVDIAARVDGRVGQRPVSRGDNVAAGQVLVAIDNPELLMKLHEAEAAKVVAVADLARIEVGTRAEVVAERKAAVAAAEASLTLAQQTYDRVKKITQGGYESVAKLDEATASLDVATRTLEQAKLAYRRSRRRLHRRGARRGTSRGRQGGGGDLDAAGAGRRDDRQGADRRAGLSGRRGARRICLARRSAAFAGRPQRRLAALRSARGSGQGTEGRATGSPSGSPRSATRP